MMMTKEPEMPKEEAKPVQVKSRPPKQYPPHHLYQKQVDSRKELAEPGLGTVKPRKRSMPKLNIDKDSMKWKSARTGTMTPRLNS